MNDFYKLLPLFLFVLFPLSGLRGQTSGNDTLPALTQPGDSRWGKIRFSGYIQGEIEIGQKDATLFVGAPKAPTENTFTRFGIRRGRLKAAYTNYIKGWEGNAVIQIDVTEKGVAVKDVYFSLTEPWWKSVSLQIGIFNRPFGNEIAYSSRLRETPERSTVFRTLFPGERETGAMLTITDPGPRIINTKLETGIFGGNGVNRDTDNRKDWITHLSFGMNHPVKWTFGSSFYLGGVYQPTDSLYIMKGNFFKRIKNRRGSYSKRLYGGIDAGVEIKSCLGKTTLRGEFIAGQQPGTALSSKSPDTGELPENLPENDIYKRKFLGWNLYFVQQILNSAHSIVLRYDGYNPNREISGDEIGRPGSFTGAADLSRQNFGIGYILQFIPQARIMVYYDFAFNEKSPYVPGYTQHRKENIFTLRLQYAF